VIFLKNAVQFGAGSIGRGFMGQLFWEAGYRTTFIEARKELVKLINEEKKYPLKLLDAYAKKEIDLIIDNIDSLEAGDREGIASVLSKVDIIGTAVGVEVLQLIAPSIAEGIKKRMQINPEPIDIYLCENTLEAYNILKKEVLDKLDPKTRIWAEDNVGFVGMVVARMVPPSNDRFGVKDPLLVSADAYHKLPFDVKNVKAELPNISGMKPVKNFKAEFERKLFTLNLGHAILGYLGYLKNYTYVHEPFDDKFTKKIFNNVLSETSRALIKKYPEDIDVRGQREMIKDVNIRFKNPMLMDTVCRVARDLIRKLGPEDRLIGSAKLCLENDVFPDNIAYVCGAAFNYDYEKDEISQKLKRIIDKIGIEEALEKISKIDSSSDFGKKIIENYYDIKKRRKDWTR